jgi:hypothetical protein
LTREARLAPAFAGAWQVSHGYLPCRYFLTAACGQLAFGNVPEMEALLNGFALSNGSVGRALDAVLGLSEFMYRAHVLVQQEAILPYTYRQSIAAIERALAEIKA